MASTQELSITTALVSRHSRRRGQPKAARKVVARKLWPLWVLSLPFVGMHVACLAAFLTGVDATALILCAVFYGIRMFGLTAGYHRYFAHRAFKTSRAMQFVFAVLGASCLQKGPLWWAGHHRHHHLYSDTENDPHSPHAVGFWWSHLGWILTRESIPTDFTGMRDFARYPELRFLNYFYWIPGLVVAITCLLIGGWSGLVWGFFVSTVMLYHATFAINSISHLIGTRRYKTSDQSRNNFVLAIFTLGEGWHNNHHHYQSSANQGFFWWEIDISYAVIRLMGLVGLVWDIRTPPQEKLLGLPPGQRVETPTPIVS